MMGKVEGEKCKLGHWRKKLKKSESKNSKNLKKNVLDFHMKGGFYEES